MGSMFGLVNQTVLFVLAVGIGARFTAGAPVDHLVTSASGQNLMKQLKGEARICD